MGALKRLLYLAPPNFVLHNTQNPFDVNLAIVGIKSVVIINGVVITP
jgi:hypothetical protein